MVTSIELDWAWFCESYHNFLKIVQKHEFFENSISQGKSVGLRLSSIVMICKNVLDVIHGLWLGFVSKTSISLKSGKMIRTLQNFGI